MSDHYEFEGKTVDDAIAKGLIELGLSKEQVTINVLRKGSRGLFGIGSESARVQLVPQTVTETENVEGNSVTDVSAGLEAVATDSASLPTQQAEMDEGASSEEDVQVKDEDAQMADTPREVVSSSDVADVGEKPSQGGDESGEWEDAYGELDDIDREVTKMAVHHLGEILHLMGYDADVEATWQEPEPDEVDSCLLLDVYGEDLDRLRNGDTINSLQYLLRLMINQKIRAWRNIVVDIDGFKAKRSQQLNQLALRMADQVMESGRAQSLEPMPANERRIVHLALRDHPDVYTESSGDAKRRKVHIIPRSIL